ncbi:MAG: S8/S53 family peptidase [Clostridia bacterium]|nr:S8/S53 family peptidase [Clostridia bacterium]
MKKVISISICLVVIAILVALVSINNFSNVSNPIDIEYRIVYAEGSKTIDRDSFLNEVSNGEIISIIITSDLKEEIEMEEIVSGDSIDVVNEKCKKHREAMQEYFYGTNLAILNALKIFETEYSYASPYSPFVTLTIRKELFDEDSFRNALKNVEHIENVCIIYTQSELTLSQSSTVVNPSNSPAYPFEDALDDCGIDFSYDGTGINVGLLELSIADPSNVDFGGRLICNSNCTYINNAKGQHATTCGLILANVATGANIYSHAFSSDSLYVYYSELPGRLDWFVNNNVRVVSMSFGYQSSNAYEVDDGIIDYYSRFSNITFAIAAGNKNPNISSNMIEHPGLALNAITVGACDANLDIASFSLYDSNNSRKITLSAPGVKLTNVSTHCPQGEYDSITQTYCHSGTSFATPIVAGVVASLMEEVTTLTSHPEAVISILVSSANQYGMSGIWDGHEGGGIVNYTNAAFCALNAGTTTPTGNNSPILEFNISVFRNSDIRVSFVWLVNSMTVDQYATYSLNVLANYDIKVYDDSDNLVALCIDSYSNIEVINFSSGGGSLFQTYTIKVYKNSSGSGNIYQDHAAVCHWYIY